MPTYTFFPLLTFPLLPLIRTFFLLGLASTLSPFDSGSAGTGRAGQGLGLGPLGVGASNADIWRGVSIYQLITDRFRPPSSTAPALSSPTPEGCPPGTNQWCGGTWRSVIEGLDYLKGMGIGAVWISPVNQNIDTQTPYGFAYHGYWVNNPLELNARFGTAEDLLALSQAIHDRGMLLMVDIVVNNVATMADIPSEQFVPLDSSLLATDTALLYHDASQYHEPYCVIDYSNDTSIQQCCLGNTVFPLLDVAIPENTQIVSMLETWITQLVSNYSIDGLRIDAAKHVDKSFWGGFCGAAGIFCTGEVYDANVVTASPFQSSSSLDSILNYPIYSGLIDAFADPGALNMSSLVSYSQGVSSTFQDPGLLCNFLENHDVPRFRNMTADPQTAWNALIWTFMADGIPVIYYGQEQELWFGNTDPYNRQALWADGNGGFSNTTATYQRIAQLNRIRQWLVSSNATYSGDQTFLNSKVQILTSTDRDVAFRKGPIITVLNNLGSPSANYSVGVLNTGWDGLFVDLLECQQYSTGSSQSISVSYSNPGQGGRPFIFVTMDDAAASGICPQFIVNTTTTPASSPTAKPPVNVNTNPNATAITTGAQIPTVTAARESSASVRMARPSFFPQLLIGAGTVALALGLGLVHDVV